MKEQQSKFHKAAALIGASVIVMSVIFLAGMVAEGQTVSMPSPLDENADSSIRGVTFPVAELGNCANKNECKNYCNQSGNMDACIAFAKDHGLMTEKNAMRALKFGKLVREKTSPGGCDSPQSCDAYCSTLSHIDECTTFAEKNGFKDEHYEQGKKIQSFLKKGGATPGNCQTKEECQSYCRDFNHAKECFDFAEKAGIMQKSASAHGNRHEPNAEQLGKIAELSQKGETPGHCGSKDECEKYCSDASHREECVEFGVKIGFIKPDEAVKIRQMGGKGPGDCNSPESCRAYCNDQSHHEECFKFAEEHGFITKEESTQAKEGWVRARQGFENAPSEVRECLKTTLGKNILDDIQAGKLVPGTDISGQVRGCFEKFGGNVHPQEALKHIPPEATACLKEKFGDTFEGVRAGKTPMTPEMADSFRVCFQMVHTTAGFTNENNGQKGQNGQGERHSNQSSQTGIENILRSAPPEVVACLKEKFPDGLDELVHGGQMVMELKDTIRGCFENLHPSMKTIPEMTHLEGAEDLRREGFGGSAVPAPPTSGLVNMPPEVLACIRGTIGEENFAKLQTAPASLELVGVIRACLEKTANSSTQETSPPSSIPSISTSAPMTFLEKFIGAALLPVRWVLGK